MSAMEQYGVAWRGEASRGMARLGRAWRGRLEADDEIAYRFGSPPSHAAGGAR